MYSNLVDMVKNLPRNIIPTKIFHTPSKICLLDFIGAPQYFISDFGVVYSRKQIYLNKDGHVSRGYEPLVKMDKNYPYPWVLIQLSTTKMWFPVNMLLGWAFAIDKVKTKLQTQMFISPMPDYWVAPLSAYKWTKFHVSKLEDGYFKKFLTTVLKR